MQFKFAHIADTHLGCHWPPVPDRRKVQGPAYIRAFEKCIDEAINREVDFVLHAGDLVDKPQPTVPALRSILSELRKLEALKIPLIITRGTHDYPRDYFDAGGDILTILEEEKKLVYVEASSQNPYCDIETDSSRIRVYGLGDYGAAQKAKLIDFSKSFTNDAEFGILLMHGGVSDVPYSIGTALRAKELRRICKKIDYLALGHDHHRFEFPSHAIYNPGSTECCSFREGGVVKYLFHDSELMEIARQDSAKGFYIVDVNDDEKNVEFVEIPSRHIVTVQVEFDGATPEEVLEGVSKALQMNQDENQVIRPMITGTLAEGHRTYEIRLREIHESAVGLYVEWPACSISDRPLEENQSAFDRSYRQILEEYFIARGSTKERAGELAALTISLVKTITSRNPSEPDAVEKAIDLIEKFRIE